MSDLKVDGIIASTGTNTALTLQGKGSGKVDIGDGALSFPDADGDADQVIKTDGSGALAFVTPAAGGAWNIIGTAVGGGGSGTSALTVTGLDATYDTYAIALSDVLPITDDQLGRLRLGDSSGVDSGASDYGWSKGNYHINTTSGAESYQEDNADSEIHIGDRNGNWIGGAATEGIGGMFFLHTASDGQILPTLTGEAAWVGADTSVNFDQIVGARLAKITVDRVEFTFASGNVESGRMTVWGLAHA